MKAEITAECDGAEYKYVVEDDGTLMVWHDGHGTGHHPSGLVPFPPEDHEPDPDLD